ncbi:RimK family alpha-L-glutamate ligase [Nostocoides sp. HKS02]|uniref:ATP-grasp domain-containing protein n=1 Tax=Nostocoides sp. HKS02 TaxID=1813880 RepID=UPI0012B47E15|nr:alpha-L-glutamate ligase [Tetrasphaera sp. HKS02]QGN56724.1 alpha-L-glutamate ligase [Tetrasphaera sp. HKS02]
MILFFGYGDDPALSRAVRAAERLEAEHLVLDQQALDGCDFSVVEWGGAVAGQLRVPWARVPLADFDAAYARPLAPVAHDPVAHQRESAIADAVVSWLDTADARVVNRPRTMHSNSSKPFQAQLIAAAGFAVPESLVTTDPDEVVEFADRVGGVVFKSISGVRSIVQRLDAGYLGRLERVRTLPTQFQAFVEGVDVRVHVVGGEVFATRIECAATDYRYAAREGLDADLTATTLSDDVAQRCVDLAASLSLPFVGIDLRETPSGDMVCFEVNPMPGYSYFESNTGQPISEALVRLLAGKTEPVADVTGQRR